MLLAVCKAKNLDYAGVPRIASGLGGGVGRQGEACGALLGGSLALGLLRGRDHAEEKEAKEAIYALTGEFARRFEAANGALRCRDLTGVDMTTETGVQQFREQNLHKVRCDEIVSNAVRALLALLDEDTP